MSTTTTRQFNAIASRVDSKTGILKDVSVITVGPCIGHGMEIDGTTLSQVEGCGNAFAGGVKVKTDHGTGFNEIVGHLKSFRVSGNKTVADLHLLKNHADFAKIVEMAETMPESFGLSISFSGGIEEITGTKFARCIELYSVDLVDRPAANPTGLFSAKVAPDIETEFLRLVAVALASQSPDDEKKVLDFIAAHNLEPAPAPAKPAPTVLKPGLSLTEQCLAAKGIKLAPPAPPQPTGLTAKCLAAKQK